MKLSNVEDRISPRSLPGGCSSLRVFYEERSDGLGADFLVAVEETTRRIEQFPDAGLIVRGGIRKRLVFGFPFAILYERQADALFIAAVMHQHRKPGYWKEPLAWLTRPFAAPTGEQKMRRGGEA